MSAEGSPIQMSKDFPVPYLVLIKHSAPKIVPDQPADQWRLSAAGRQRAARLAPALKKYAPAVIAAGVEPKAVETARIVAASFGQEVHIAPGLHEHNRRNVGWFDDAAAFEQAVAAFFASPRALVMGAETANEAHARFSAAIAALMAQYAGQTVAVVSHGTVITLFVTRLLGLAPFAFWQRLGLPSIVALSWPDVSLLAVENIA